ncbi:MAG: MucR family transcriptional regulator [Alphaproteobacteria bacterium]|nr:MucR family transcriptional regulator [Alphaproteobacteria bacterium]
MDSNRHQTNGSQDRDEDLVLSRVTEIVTAYLSKNSLPPEDVPALIKSVHATLGGIAGEAPAARETREPAVSIKKSVKPDYIVCLEDGKKLKMLKRYLRARYNMSPDEYRARWGLPADYPMTAPNYAAKRSEFAKKFGLGKPGKKNKK